MTNYFHLLSIGLIIGLSLVSCSKDSAPNFHRLSVITTPSEGGTVTPGPGEYEEGTEIELTAKPNEDWAFEKWHGDYDGNSPVATIKMDSSMVIVASFIKRDYPLTILIEGEGQVLQEIVRSKSTDYPHGTTVKLTAEPDHGWYFTHWEGDLESEENPAEIIVENETEITAVFERLDFPLTINIEGDGTVTQQIVPAKTTDYTFETVIELTAKPEPGWTFSQWEGDLSGSENPIEITIDDEKEVTAIFEENPYTLTVVIEGEGEVEQSVLPSKSTVYPFGTTVSLEAFAADKWDFSHWNEDKEDTNNPTTVLVDKNVTVKATFYTIPELTTKEVTHITDSSAVSGGVFSEDSHFEITDKGVCFSTSQNPSVGSSTSICTNNGRNDGEYSSLMSDLTSDTEYYVRAYASYRGRNIYGNQVSFTTAQEISVPGAPVITEVIAGDGEITVHFEAPEDDGGSPISRYEYRLNSDSGNSEVPDVDIGLDSPFTIREGENDGDGLYEIVNGVEYTVWLRAVNIEGAGAWAEADPVIPQAPIFLNKNGVTIMCPNAEVGDFGLVDGIEYEVVDRAMLDQKIRDRVDITRVCTSLISDMNELLYGTTLNQEIGSWDVSNVTNMSRMFFDNFHFDQDISAWDVSNVTDMSGMFALAERFNSPIGDWDVSSVTDMSYMFIGDTNPNEDGVIFNQDISEWDVSSVINMQGMFNGSAFNKDISEWDVSNVTDMSDMFRDARFNHPINNWDVSNVENMSGMFSVWHREDNPFNQEIGEWDVSSVTNMSLMFNGSVFNQDISNWDVSNVTNMVAMFSGESYEGYHYNPFNHDISGWDVSNVINMSEMFFHSEFNQDIGAWDVSHVVNMSGMFSESPFNHDISKWDVSNVTSMKRMFSYAVSFNQNLSGWCVVNITSKPDEFDDGANRWRQQRPNWGTCPGED